MKSCIALLRGVNVGGNKKVSMTGLRALAAGLDLENARTLLQSGNLVFRARDGETSAALEGRLEAAAAQHLGLTTDFLVRDAQEWEAIMAGNPFLEMAATDPGHLVVACLKTAPAPGAAATLQAAVQGPEKVHVAGRQAYITYPAGIGDSKLTAAVLDRHLGTRSTSRNWNTVRKLAALARE